MANAGLGVLMPLCHITSLLSPHAPTHKTQALHAGFVQCDEDVNAKYKQSGTTATLAVQVSRAVLATGGGGRDPQRATCWRGLLPD